ncbi:MAG: hypothetical protein R2731_15470 [Nocardioides sp.]
MTISAEQAAWFARTFDQLTDNIEQAVLGKRHVVRLVLTCLLSEGTSCSRTTRAPARRCWPGRWRTRCRAATPGSSSPRTCSPRTSPG